MARRTFLGWLPVAALALCVWTGCKDKPDEAKPAAAGTVDLEKRCVQLAKICGDKDKHVEKIVQECKQAATKQAAQGCIDKTTAVYDCYEKDLCGTGDKVWALDDLRVLAERHKKCVAEQDAARQCAQK
jgi:hypothetical protein